MAIGAFLFYKVYEGPPDGAHTSACEATCYPAATSAPVYIAAKKTWACACIDPADPNTLHVQPLKLEATR